jgi:N-acetylglucosamine malate deacetylase 2
LLDGELVDVMKKTNNRQPYTLLVITAHPDDESFPMGGTLAKYAAEGARIVLVAATSGEAGIPGVNPSQAAALRKNELGTAAAILGVARLEFLDYPDGNLAGAEAGEVISRLVGIMEAEAPQAVITFGPDGISGHPDHIAIYRFTTQAVRQASIKAQLYYLTPSEATQQGCGVPLTQRPTGAQTVGIDVGAFLVTKVRAMQAHASQNPPFPGDPVTEAQKLTCHEYFTLAGLPDSFADRKYLFAAFWENVPMTETAQHPAVL